MIIIRSFYNKLKLENNKISIIGEIKRASPSLGDFLLMIQLI